MRSAGRVVATALLQMRKQAAVGVSLLELDEVARAVLAEHGATSPFLHCQPSFAHIPFPAVICASVSDRAAVALSRSCWEIIPLLSRP